MAATERPSVLRSPRRLALAALGLICVGLGFLGVFVPGLPTTIFLIAASYLFARSCPWLEERLLSHRIFRPYRTYLDGSQPMPLRARIVALAMMWIAVSLSVGIIGFETRASTWIALTVLAAACVGTAVLITIRRPSRT